MNMSALKPIVIDTNILLDCFVFKDAHTTCLHQHIVTSSIRWIATSAMEEEFLRVLDYKNIARWASTFEEQEKRALQNIFKTHAHMVAAPPPAIHVTCRDTDDQMFIDLSVHHQSILLSKDKQVLKLRNKLLKLGVDVLAHYPINSSS